VPQPQPAAASSSATVFPLTGSRSSGPRGERFEHEPPLAEAWVGRTSPGLIQPRPRPTESGRIERARALDVGPLAGPRLLSIGAARRESHAGGQSGLRRRGGVSDNRLGTGRADRHGCRSRGGRPSLRRARSAATGSRGGSDDADVAAEGDQLLDPPSRAGSTSLGNRGTDCSPRRRADRAGKRGLVIEEAFWQRLR